MGAVTVAVVGVFLNLSAILAHGFQATGDIIAVIISDSAAFDRFDHLLNTPSLSWRYCHWATDEAFTLALYDSISAKLV